MCSAGGVLCSVGGVLCSVGGVLCSVVTCDVVLCCDVTSCDIVWCRVILKIEPRHGRVSTFPRGASLFGGSKYDSDFIFHDHSPKTEFCEKPFSQLCENRKLR